MIHVCRAFLYISFALLLYTWVAYPLLVAIMRPAAPAFRIREELPTVTVLVTVWNGARQIAERLRNILSQDYPASRLRVFVASDGSTDGTVQAAHSIGDSRVTVKQFPHGGKSVTQNAAIGEISDDIVVFTDVDTRFAPTFIKEVVRPFSDPQVGCVSGRLLFPRTGQGMSHGQSLYWRFETWLRARESRVGLLTTASGACMACRRPLLHPLKPQSGEDCTIPLDTVDLGYKVAHMHEAVAYDNVPDTVIGELRARTRMTCRNLRGTITHSRLLNPFRHPGYAVVLWSHKMCRWMTPLFTLAILLSSLALYSEFKALVWAELLFMGSSILGLTLNALGIEQSRIISLPFSIVLANGGFLLGLIQFLRNHDVVSYRNMPPLGDRIGLAQTVR